MPDSQNKNYNDMSESEKKKEDWMNNKWRPMMGWMYMVVCTSDFVLFPILWGVLQTLGGGRVETQWQPITLQGAGLFHIAMGAILGIAAYGRTQEKLGGANNGGLQVPSQTPSSFGAPVGNGGFASTTNSFNAPKPAAPAPRSNLAPVSVVPLSAPVTAPVEDTHTNFNPSFTPSGSYKPSTDPRALSVIDYDDHDDEPDLTRAK